MRKREFWQVFQAISDATSVRVKIMGIVLGLVILLGITLTFQMRFSLRTSMVEQLEKRGVSIAWDIAARSLDLVLTNNVYTLHQLLKDTLTNNEDVRYAFIVDPGGNILAHTFGEGFPRDLLEANSVSDREKFRIEILDTDEGLIHDIAVPIFDGRAGVARVGMTEHSLQKALAATTWRMLLVTFLVSLLGIAAAYFLTRVLTKPILELVRVTGAVARGDLNQKARVWARDEIGRLSMAFNTMTENLAALYNEKEESNRQLLRRNQELTTIWEITSAASRSLNLDKVLNDVLDKVIERLGLMGGAVLIAEPEIKKMVPRVIRGQGNGLLPESGFSDVLRQSAASAEPTTWKTEFKSGISIPLVARNRLVGLMELYGSRSINLSEQDSQMLTTIGHQVGVAIENALLWEELKQKEEIRRQLLEKIITAQEEERKRIARELHDETSQSLTSLMVGLKTLAVTHDAGEIHEKIAELRSLLAKTIEEVHKLAWQLRPSVLDDLGLIEALERYIRDYSRKFNLDVDFQITGFDGRRLAPEVETALYRIVQEALTNVARHARARNVSVVLEYIQSHIMVIVEDDGVGFDVIEALGSEVKEKSLGIYGMQERAALVGGTLTIESQPGNGTTVYVRVPLPLEG